MNSKIIIRKIEVFPKNNFNELSYRIETFFILNTELFLLSSVITIGNKHLKCCNRLIDFNETQLFRCDHDFKVIPTYRNLLVDIFENHDRILVDLMMTKLVYDNELEMFVYN